MGRVAEVSGAAGCSDMVKLPTVLFDFLTAGSDDDTPVQSPKQRRRQRPWAVSSVGSPLSPRSDASGCTFGSIDVMPPCGSRNDSESWCSSEATGCWGLPAPPEDDLQSKLHRVLRQCRPGTNQGALSTQQVVRWGYPHPPTPELLGSPEQLLSDERRRELAVHEELRKGSEGEQSTHKSQVLFDRSSNAPRQANQFGASQFWCCWWVGLAVIKFLRKLRRPPRHRRRRAAAARRARAEHKKPKDWVDAITARAMARRVAEDVRAAVSVSEDTLLHAKIVPLSMRHPDAPPLPGIPRNSLDPSLAASVLPAAAAEGSTSSESRMGEGERRALEALRKSTEDAHTEALERLRFAVLHEDKERRLSGVVKPRALDPGTVLQPRPPCGVTPLRFMTAPSTLSGTGRVASSYMQPAPPSTAPTGCSARRRAGPHAGAWLLGRALLPDMAGEGQSGQRPATVGTLLQQGFDDLDTTTSGTPIGTLRDPEVDSGPVVPCVAALLADTWEDEPLPTPPAARAGVQYRPVSVPSEPYVPKRPRRPRGDGGTAAQTAYENFLSAVADAKQGFSVEVRKELRRVEHERHRTLLRRLKVLMNADPHKQRLDECLDDASRAVKQQTAANARRERDELNMAWYRRLCAKVLKVPNAARDGQVVALLNGLEWWFAHACLNKAAFARIVRALSPEVLFGDDAQFILERVGVAFEVTHDEYVALLRQRHVHYRIDDAVALRQTDSRANFVRRSLHAERLVELQLSMQHKFDKADADGERQFRAQLRAERAFKNRSELPTPETRPHREPQAPPSGRKQSGAPFRHAIRSITTHRGTATRQCSEISVTGPGTGTPGLPTFVTPQSTSKPRSGHQRGQITQVPTPRTLEPQQAFGAKMTSWQSSVKHTPRTKPAQTPAATPSVQNTSFDSAARAAVHQGTTVAPLQTASTVAQLQRMTPPPESLPPAFPRRATNRSVVIDD
eukprot:TRINITY_DN21528_c0_g1_i1.p1 TRINITY_DN21528_c0_g1~~TRINITY_DN21528_c0_g1_i1.p1  ORF type:complete len:987 (+),score=192.20 TRINITY_DN21528_c0_g1_i1:78-2963(+)